MGMISLIERIAEKQRARIEKHQASFKQLVTMVADGKEPNVDLVEETLAASGKSLDDLQAAVQLLERRRALRKQFDQGPAFTKERAELEKKIITADQAFEQAERRHEAAVAPLVARMSQVVTGQRQAETAREQLTESCADLELVTALAETTAHLRVLTERRAELRQRFRDERDWAASCRSEIPHARSEAHAAELRERTARHAHDAETCEHELAECEAAIEDAEACERDVRERMLEP
jgi:hypothetical protein